MIQPEVTARAVRTYMLSIVFNDLFACLRGRDQTKLLQQRAADEIWISSIVLVFMMQNDTGGNLLTEKYLMRFKFYFIPSQISKTKE